MAYVDDLKQRKDFLAKLKSNPMTSVFFDQYKRFVEPFRIYGNVYFVGDSWVCVHLIDTGDGLLLIDSGNCGATAMLIQTIWEAGFNPRDVRWIIHSHGHVDHIGGAGFFRNMFGTKLILSERDAEELFRRRPEMAFVQDSPNLADDIFVPDIEIKDGDVMAFGNTVISFFEVPGHTPGCLAMFFDAYEGDEKKRCGYYGGFGFNTLTKDALTQYGDSEFTTWKTYEESLLKVMDQPVDIFLGNHTADNKTLEKRQLIKAGASENPFIDPGEFKRFLTGKQKALHEFVEAEKTR